MTDRTVPFTVRGVAPETPQHYCPHCKESIPSQGYHWGGFEWVCATAESRAAADDGETLDYGEGDDDSD